MAITLTAATTHLDEWLAADLAVAGGQSYSINGRILTRANANEISEKIQYWSKVESSLLRIANGQPATGYSRAKFNI